MIEVYGGMLNILLAPIINLSCGTSFLSSFPVTTRTSKEIPFCSNSFVTVTTYLCNSSFTFDSLFFKPIKILISFTLSFI